jgi:hypothetical protein
VRSHSKIRARRLSETEFRIEIRAKFRSKIEKVRLRTLAARNIEYFFSKLTYGRITNFDSEVDHGGKTQSDEAESCEEDGEAQGHQAQGDEAQGQEGAGGSQDQEAPQSEAQSQGGDVIARFRRALR